jgi:hypothetical protein
MNGDEDVREFQQARRPFETIRFVQRPSVQFEITGADLRLTSRLTETRDRRVKAEKVACVPVLPITCADPHMLH